MDAMFTHLVSDVAECFDDSNVFDTDAQSPARIDMSMSGEEGLWVSANSEGYLHLARVFAELGLRKLEDGYHFHKNGRFQSSKGPPEFTFEVDNSVAMPGEAEEK
ncbi:MAG: hypothetical protein ABIQ32_00735 [Sphingomicrobium sp.]